MKSLTILEPGQIELLEKPMPVPGKGEALLKMLYGGICGSDLGTYKGTFSYAAYPRIPGHEMSCEIVEIGDNAYGLEKGMVVTCNPYFNCGHCYSCRRGFVNCCTRNETMGAQRDGAFSEYIAMPAERIYSGRNLDPQMLALVEPFCISSHAISRIGVKPGEKVFIAGAGAIGIFAMLAAKLAGARAYVSDVVPEKLEWALKMGADGVLSTGSQDFEKAAEAYTEGNGFDAAVEAAGFPSAFLDCINVAAYRGRVAAVGISKQNVDFNYSIIQKKELDVFGSRNALKEDFIRTIELLGKGGLDLSDMITGVYGLEDAGSAFKDLASGKPALKTLIRF